MSHAADAFVESYLAANAGHPVDVSRVVDQPSGLDAAGMMDALEHPAFKEPGRQPLALQMMADFMAPDGSIYYDAIYGDFRGQSAIRNWLIPTMALIDFIDFVPTQESVLLDDGLGGTSVDEWQMVANIGDDKVPLSRGVSVRRFRDGWITWACDVYDTSPFRIPNPNAPADAPVLPDVPRTVWVKDPAVPDVHVSETDFNADADEFAVESVYLDPLFGEMRGRDGIRAWMTDIMGKVGNVVFEQLGPMLDNGDVSVGEWQQMAVQPDGSRVFMARGTSVRRRRNGEIVYAADYFDTASFADPAVQAAGIASGSTMTVDDIMRYRGVPS
jgi:hypothetical protein